MTQGWLFSAAELLPQGRGADFRGLADVHSERRPTWSYSKSQTLNTCSRRYYYDYFGASKKHAQGDPNKAEIVQLSNFSTRHLRAGTLLHLGIRTFYKKLLAGEGPLAPGLAGWVRRLFESDRTASRMFCRTGTVPQGEGFQPAVLLEFVRSPKEADALFETVSERLDRAFTNFLTGPACAPYRNPDLARDAHIEKRFKIEVSGLAIGGQVDFACRTSSGFRIVDWKIGDDAIVAPESLQLLSYALWATEALGVPLAELEILQVPLLGHPRDPVRVTPGMVELARSRIIEEIEMTGALETFGRQGLVSAFTPRDHPKICALCPYREPCWRGRKLA